MKFIFDTRASDSPFVEAIWRTQSSGGGTFVSLAESHWGLVVTNQNGKTNLTVLGPETKAMSAPVPEDAEFIGIVFKLGTFMPHLPVSSLVDKVANLPEATDKSFWMNGSAWQFPTYENADTFVDRLVRKELLVREPIVEAALQGELKEVSLRSIQRHFLRATGLTHNTVRQIERARRALILLQQGTSIIDTVHQVGYFDQPHLTRSLKHLLGQTPTQIASLSDWRTGFKLSASSTYGL
jgi:AraC-like DNA-binding protein